MTRPDIVGQLEQYELKRAQKIEQLRFPLGTSPKARRRAEELRARHRAKARHAAGAGIDARNERFAEPWVEPDDSNLSVILWWVGGFITYVVFGLARLGGWFLLGLFERKVPNRATRVPLWHLTAAGAIALLVWLPVAGAVGGFGAWLLAQFALAPIFAAWRGYKWGWSACLNHAPLRPMTPHETTPQEENQAVYGTLPVLGEVESPSQVNDGFFVQPLIVDSLPDIPEHLRVRPSTDDEGA